MQPIQRDLKQLFDIKFETAGDEQQVLSIRLGEKHCCFVITNKTATSIYHLIYSSLDHWTEDEWKMLFESYPALNNSFYEVLVAFDFSESSLAPINESYDFLKPLYGLNGDVSLISEAITGWQLNNVYAVSSALKEWINNKFPTARFWHQYTLGIRNSTSSLAAGEFQVDFRKDEFVIIAVASNKILLTQTYEYSNPEDVLFYLLKICNQFNLSTKDVQIHLSGLMDKNSSLYKELYQYFINIEFRDSTWNTGPDYPAHFFTSLNDLAKCVS